MSSSFLWLSLSLESSCEDTFFYHLDFVSMQERREEAEEQPKYMNKGNKAILQAEAPVFLDAFTWIKEIK